MLSGRSEKAACCLDAAAAERGRATQTLLAAAPARLRFDAMERILVLLLLAASLAGCGGGSSSAAPPAQPPPPPPPPPPATVSLSGQVTFDFVPAVPGRGLDYAATEARPARGVTVELLTGSTVTA